MASSASLKLAVESCCLDVLEELLSQSPDMDSSMLYRTLLVAVRRGFAEGVRVLLPRVDQPLNLSKLLHDACASGSIEVLRELTRTMPTEIDEVTFYLALLGDEAVALYLVEHCGAALDLGAALVRAADGGHLAVVHALLDRGAFPEARALEAACAGNRADVVDLLLQRGAVATEEAWWMATVIGGGAQALDVLRTTSLGRVKRNTCTAYRSPPPHLVPMPTLLGQ